MTASIPLPGNTTFMLSKTRPNLSGLNITDGRACALSDVACTSFFPSKPLGAYGDGGMCFTQDEHLAEVMRSMRIHGQGVDKYENVRIGY